MNLQKAFSTNQTTASITYPACTLTAPSGAGVVPLTVGGIVTHDLEVMPYGAGLDTNTGLLSIIGWRKVGITWVPTELCLLTSTLSTFVGITGGDVIATDRFADAIVATKGLVVLPSVNDEVPARAIVNVYGFEYVQFLTGLNSSSTNVNALYMLQPTMRSEHKV